jgi:hypothetical protein
MPRVRFESTTPVFERANIVHVLDRQLYIIFYACNLMLPILSTYMHDNYIISNFSGAAVLNSGNSELRYCSWFVSRQ